MDFQIPEDLITEAREDKLQKKSRQDKKDEKDNNYQQQKQEYRKIKHQREKQLRYEKLQQFKTQEEIDAYLKERKLAKQFKKENGLLQTQSKYRVVIDCGFEDSMADREQKSLAKQMSHLYSENRKLKFPIKIYITNIYPTLEKWLQVFNYEKWPINSSKEPFYEIEELKGSNFVYLTPDAEEEIQEIKEDEVYIIGGLVDKPIIKNATLNRAQMLNIRKAKLPIGGMIKANFKKCLNVSTAALFIPNWLELRDWQATFEKIVPLKFYKD